MKIILTESEMKRFTQKKQLKEAYTFENDQQKMKEVSLVANKIKLRYFGTANPTEDMVREKTQELIKMYQEGNSDAGNDAILINGGFIVYVMRKSTAGLSDKATNGFTDIFHEAIANIKGKMMTYNPDKGANFITFITPIIKQTVWDYLGEHGQDAVRLPHNAMTLGKKIEKIKNQWENEFQTEPSDEEIARVLWAANSKAMTSLADLDDDDVDIELGGSDTYDLDAALRMEIDDTERFNKLVNKVHDASNGFGAAEKLDNFSQGDDGEDADRKVDRISGGLQTTSQLDIDDKEAVLRQYLNDEDYEIIKGHFGLFGSDESLAGDNINHLQALADSLYERGISKKHLGGERIRQKVGEIVKKIQRNSNAMEAFRAVLTENTVKNTVKKYLKEMLNR